MGLDDFKKIQEENNVEKDKNDKNLIEDINVEDIEYYLSHLDELLKLVKESHLKYVNAKLRYDFKKDDYQISINWNEENALRESNGLAKVTNQTQRDSVINLKLKPLQVTLKSCELEYKFYSKIFTFISNNFDLLCAMYEDR